MTDEQTTDEKDNREREPSSLACYVYGVVGANVELAPGVMGTGLDEVHEVFLIDGESVAAVASLVALDEFGEEALEERLSDLSWLEHRARGHEQILDRIREQTTLVPMRLCTIYRSESSVREMLAKEQAFLADALRRLQGRTEWGLKMYAVSDPGEALGDPGEALGDPEEALGDPEEVLAEAEEVPGGPEEAHVQDIAEDDAAENGAPGQVPGPGASYLMGKRLQGRRREHAEALIEERCELAHSELAQVSVDAKLNPVQPRELTGRDEPMIFNGVYLVDDAAFESFIFLVRALEADLAENGLELELTGPWTPYNFVGSPAEVGR